MHNSMCKKNNLLVVFGRGRHLDSSPSQHKTLGRFSRKYIPSKTLHAQDNENTTYARLSYSDPAQQPIYYWCWECVAIQASHVIKGKKASLALRKMLFVPCLSTYHTSTWDVTRGGYFFLEYTPSNAKQATRWYTPSSHPALPTFACCVLVLPIFHTIYSMGRKHSQHKMKDLHIL